MASATPWLPLANTLSDKAVTEPLVSVTIPATRPSVYIGAPFDPTRNFSAPRVENFNPPRYQPDARYVPKSTIYTQGSGNVLESCPVVPILLRNEWEVTNTSQGKVWGGYDFFNIQNIPSCGEREGDYMNFLDFTNPWSRVFVESYEDPPVMIDSHAYGKIL